MKAMHLKDIKGKVHAPSIHMPHMHMPQMHMPSAHLLKTRANNLVHDPRFWAVLAMALITALVITLAVLTRPTGGPVPEPTTPIIPGPFIY